jgi:hypothetical protein
MYTDKDILDLYTCLQGIGLAETPAEEAQRHYKSLINIMWEKSIIQTKPIRFYFRDYLLQNHIPHTYASTSIIERGSYFPYYFYFVIRGKVFQLTVRGIAPLDPIPPDIVFHQDLPSLVHYAKSRKAKGSNPL